MAPPNTKPPPLAAHGLPTLNTTSPFDSNAPYTYCRICGQVYQTENDRKLAGKLTRCGAVDPSIRKLQMLLKEGRKTWSRRHAKQHTDVEHQLLALSGLWLTPDAAYRLAAYGIVPVSDMVLDPTGEVAAALLEAPTEQT